MLEARTDIERDIIEIPLLVPLNRNVEALPVKISATQFAWNPNIEPREWLYGFHLQRKYASGTVAPGGVGKSKLIISEALSMVIGRRLLDVPTYRRPLKVWYWNLEDDADELQRLIQAACKLHRITPEDIDGRLYIDSGRDQSLCTACISSGRAEILEPVYEAITAELKRREIDVLIIDPFVSSHQITENDNGMIDAVTKRWSKVANDANCAIELIHHSRKEGGGAITADSARGGGAFVGALREVRVLNRLDPDTAKELGIENPRRYFYAKSDKANNAPIGSGEYYHLESVDLDNATDELLGDSVGVVSRWYKPDILDDVTDKMRRAAFAIIAAGECRSSAQSPDWTGHKIAHVLNLDSATNAGKSKIKGVLREWEKADMLTTEKRRDTLKGKDHPFHMPGAVQW